MGKTYRERLIDTLNHRDPGQVVVDLGSTFITGININALVKLRKGLGLEDITPVMDEPLQLLGRVDEDLRQAVGAGVIGVNNGYTIFGYKNRDWKEWTLHNGLKMLVSEEFRTSTDERGNTYIYAQGNTNYPPAGKMPKDGFFFDNITRSDATAEDEDLNAREDYKDDFKVFTDEALRFIQDDVNNIYENTGYGMIYNGALCGIGDFALVPGPHVCDPKGRFGLIDKKKLYADSRALLDQVGLRDMDPSTLVRNINVSQQQQVEIAKALSQNARFLILDEPTSALTPNETKVLFEIMAELKRKGFAMLYITHKLDEIMSISDRITVLRDGKYIGTLVTKETTITDMISMMVGREYSGGYTRAHYMDDEDYARAKPLMEVRNLSVKGKVEDVSFTLYEGEVLGLAGLVGAGRSEVLQAVFGADPRVSGQVFVNGQELTRKNTREAIRHGIGLVPEGRKTQGLYLKFSVEDNMTIVWLNSTLKSLGLINSRSEAEHAQAYRERLRVKTPSLEQRIVNLSGGNQQKAIIARWLMNEPKILFLDEPTQGIDVGAKNEIYEIIDQLAASGVSVVMVSSEMQENISLCDRIVVLYEGKITGTIRHAQANEKSVMALMSGQKQ